MNIGYLLAATERSFGEKPAVCFGYRRIHTYSELHSRAARLAGGLRALPKMQPGDRVALAMKNCPQYIEAMWACWHAGLCAVPINAKLHPREIAFILENTGARLCFVTDDLAEALIPLERGIDSLERVICVDTAEFDRLAEHEALPLQRLHETDPAWLFYTSGTTGRPKGAVLTHRSLLAMTLRYYTDIDQVSDVDCMIHAAPFLHATGLYSPRTSREARRTGLSRR